MTTTADEHEDLTRDVRPSNGAPGSAARAFLGWRTTAAAMLPLWIGLASIAQVATVSGDGEDDIGWMAMTAFLFLLGVLLIVPAFAFTIGRWLDRRTAARGVGFAVAIFAACGLGFGIAVGAVIGAGGDATAVGIGALIAAPTIAAAAGRLLCELRGPVWSAVVWGLFVIALAPTVLFVVVYVGASLL